MPTCTPPGWGSQGWGWASFGGGGPLSNEFPTHAPFDVYCVGPCDEMKNILTYQPEQFSSGLIIDPLTENLVLLAAPADAERWLLVNKSVPDFWTLEYTVIFTQLPPKLYDVHDSMGHIFLGAWNQQGVAAGLFFSASGIGYAADVLDPIIPIPDSENLIALNESYTVRLVSNFNTQALFIYITKSSDLDSGLGHQLRFILPAPSKHGVQIEHTLVSVVGAPGITNGVELVSICMGTGAIIPNMPPLADAGNDQEVMLCTIGQLNGAASYDPEGAPVGYFWRIVEAPVASKYVFEGYDAWTDPDTSGFINQFHTYELINAGTFQISAGDVVVFGGSPYTVVSVNTLTPGDTVITIDGYFLPAGESGAHYYKLVQQDPLNGAHSVNPTFFVDVAGLWRFDLVVDDGHLHSEPAFVVVSVRESPVPRGFTPDLSFAWGYLSDFWKLVEDKEPITVVWSAFAQVVASEILKLWQIDYNKSLRDIQRTLVRKWLYYDLMLQEPFYDLAKVQIMDQVPDGYLRGDGGQVLPAQPPTPPSIPLPMSVNPFGYRTNADLSTADVQKGDLLILEGIGYRIYQVLTETVPGVSRGELVLMDPIYSIGDPIPDKPSWKIVRPCTSSQIDFWGGLVVGGVLSGAQDLSDDVIVEVLEKSTGAFQYFRSKVFGVCEQLPNGVAVDPTPWKSYVSDPNFSLFLVGVFRRWYVPINDRIRDIPYLQAIVKDPPVDEVLQRNVDFFIETFRGRSCIRFEDVWQHIELDQGGAPTWVPDPTPPMRLWGEFNYIENLSVVESNFGKIAGLTIADTESVSAQMPGQVDYLSAVRGLWYVYFSCASLQHLRVGAQILLGLPYAEEDGLIVSVTTHLNGSATRVLVQDGSENGIVRSYDFALGLDLEVNPATGLPYVPGDFIAQFAPLCTGVTVVDYVKQPNWIGNFIAQDVLTELHKFFLFPVIIEPEAYTLAGALLVRNLMLNVRPSYTYPIIIAKFEPQPCDIDVEDDVGMTVFLRLREGHATKYPNQHPSMWNVGDPGPVSFFPPPDGEWAIHHRHEHYPFWFSSWRSAYGIKDYADEGYARFVAGASADLPLSLDPPVVLEAVAASWIRGCIRTHCSVPAPGSGGYYLLVLSVDGTDIGSFTFYPQHTVGEATTSFDLAIDTAPGQVVSARVEYNGLPHVPPTWDDIEVVLYGTYAYTAPNCFGYFQGPPSGSTPSVGTTMGGEFFSMEDSLRFTYYEAWPVAKAVQYGEIFAFGDPVYPAYLDDTQDPAVFVMDLANPTLSVPPDGSGDPGWSFGQLLDPPASPYTGYARKKIV